MKKYIFTESQIKKIIDNTLMEQPGTYEFDRRLAINRGSEDFLNSKKITGVDLTDKIKKYQKSIGCSETGHMMDCLDVMFNKHRKDFELWKSMIQKNKPLMDKIGDWLYGAFNIKGDPKSVY
jgi:hypothetical protein